MLEKRFNFSETEAKCIESWSKNKTFNFKSELEKPPFCIMMPPPNVTGSLHIGHALTFTLQDILVRFHKKLGKNVLWQPGTDHAGIATEIVVEKMIKEQQKINKKQIGRQKFIKKIWEWKEESGNKIIDQMKRLGTSVDWSISRFTMDEELSEAVKEVFITLFNKGMIYKDKRLVNWDPKLETAVSDLEVNQVEKTGKMWFIRYELEEIQKSIVVGTTRPETIFGDSAIAIHPKNSKLNDFIGQKATIPILNKKIPVISDEYADPDKGTGAVKITPAHDFNDFEIGKKHNLEFINIFDKKANLNYNTPKDYKGLNRFVARKKVIEELNKTKNIVKITDNKMVVPIGDRSDEIIEPLLTNQWFLDTKKICLNIEKEIENNNIKFHPSSWINTFKHWIKNIEPWCVSRQIWWGHRIPIWYSDKNIVIAAKSKDEAQNRLTQKNKDAKITHQEDDVLDTWFSSALWPFSTLGWPKKEKLLERFYPTNVLVTGFDIIFFWVARMIMMGKEFMKELPFKDIYIHPLVKDEKGEKMSKSKGNVIDPIILINLYGSDALRFTLANLSTQGRDIKLSNKLVENSRNFITKIWNVARFSQFNKFIYDKEYNPDSSTLPLNKWILFKFQETQKKVVRNLESFKFNLVISDLYQFLWGDFCDLYIELSKNYLKDEKYHEEISGIFNFIFFRSLNLINPVIPFITEKLGKELGYINESFFDEQISLNLKLDFKKSEVDDFSKFIQLIKALRVEIIGNSEEIQLLVLSNKEIKWIEDNILLIRLIFKFKDISYKKVHSKDNQKTFVISGVKFVLISNNKSKSIEKLSLQSKIDYYRKEINFFMNKLNNKNFIDKAPPNIVEEQRTKLRQAEKNLELLIQK